MTIQTPAERNRVKELEAENARLKMLVADLTLEKAILESTVAVIDEAYGSSIRYPTANWPSSKTSILNRARFPHPILPQCRYLGSTSSGSMR